MSAATETWCHQATCDDRGFWLVAFPVLMVLLAVSLVLLVGYHARRRVEWLRKRR